MLAGKILALKYFPNCFWDSAVDTSRYTLRGRRKAATEGLSSIIDEGDVQNITIDMVKMDKMLMNLALLCY
jgi:hypothetical protein